MNNISEITVTKLSVVEFCRNPKYHMPYLSDHAVQLERDDGHSCTLIPTSLFDSFVAAVGITTREGIGPSERTCDCEQK